MDLVSLVELEIAISYNYLVALVILYAEYCLLLENTGCIGHKSVDSDDHFVPEYPKDLQASCGVQLKLKGVSSVHRVEYGGNSLLTLGQHFRPEALRMGSVSEQRVLAVAQTVRSLYRSLILLWSDCILVAELVGCHSISCLSFYFFERKTNFRF